MLMVQKKKKSTNKKRSQKAKQKEQLKFILIGLAFMLFSLLGAFKLGFLGILIANSLRIIAGNTFVIAAFLLFLYGALLIIYRQKFFIKKPRLLIGAILLYLGILLFLHVLMFKQVTKTPNILGTTWEFLKMDFIHSKITKNVGGGMLGAILYQGTFFLVSKMGSYFVSIILILIGCYLISMKDVQQLLNGLEIIQEKMGSLFEQNQKRQAAKEIKRAEKKAKKAKKQAEMEEKAKEKLKNKDREKQEEIKKETLDNGINSSAISTNEGNQEDSIAIPITDFQNVTTPQITPLEEPSRITEDEESESIPLNFEITEEMENRDYQLPSSTLLDSISSTDQSGEYKKIEKNIGVLEQTFQSFGVDAKVVKASLGPAVTKFEIQPAVGVKVSKIVGLTDDIALALAAKDVRMEAPIPGKSLIGIEVPNSTISMVSFREVIESQPNHPEQLLEVPLGRDISGAVRTADLTKMPHLLIAGSTGSGKSVAINGIIASILMRAKPHEVKLMMIDPKMVELNVYNGIPHLLTPVVTNPKKAAQALQKVVQEMELRYEKFAAAGTRNITSYNELVKQKNLEDGENRSVLPFIVVIVDELADLMMVASNEVEDAIIRLAQMARAAGIHMILATQRPSVDVITGIIKANVPSRMAFAVSSGTDSRTIIDTNGAEKLLGRGDMLFLPMGENKPIRIQGAFISDHEVEKLVSFVTQQQEAEYQENMMPEEETTNEASNHSQPKDDLYEEAKNLVVEMQTASISLLQRRFRIGYNRAARLVDELEASGIIGPSEGSKPRKVLIEATVEEMSTNNTETPI
ncbi:DNA translocase FtsK [Melissococcus plutonius]|uniref:DNA translocase FtsK n=2 Tax=Melissococcus plutonius TaxID=33970 RepID=A0A2Z5Y2X9_9ENTE|nr:DNA translocase FtsK [Melissococcus plutonius]